MTRATELAVNDKAVQDRVLRGTPPQFDASNALATMEAVQRALGNFNGQTSLTAPAAILPAMAGSRIVVNGQGTLTLPLFADSPTGSVFYFINTGANALTITTQANEIIVAYTANFPSFSLPAGASAVIARGNVNYVFEEGSEALQYSTSMSRAIWTTPPQFDNAKKLATTEFIKRAGVEFSAFNSVGASTALSLAAVGGVTSAASASAMSLTMPPTAQVANGATLMLVSAGSGVVTVLAPNGSTLTNASGVGITVELKQGDTALFCKVATEWRLAGGTVSLKHAAAFAAALNSVAASQGLPSGLTLKAGSFSSTSTASEIPLTFPVSFPNQCVALILNPWVSAVGIYTHSGRDRSGAMINRGSNTNFQFDYIAIGY